MGRFFSLAGLHRLCLMFNRRGKGTVHRPLSKGRLTLRVNTPPLPVAMILLLQAMLPNYGGPTLVCSPASMTGLPLAPLPRSRLPG